MISMLKIENLCYKKILKDVSLDLEEKSFNVLVGSNGCGKTTLVKAIAGLIKCSGNIFVLNNLVSIDSNNEIKKNIGICIEPVFTENTVFDCIISPLLNLSYDDNKAREMVYEITKKLDIEYLLFKNVDTLSLSQKKIVNFAISIIHNPKLVVIDDSFDELDNYYRSKIITYLKKMKKNTILFITNNVDDILLADNIIFMDDGKIIDYGKLDEIIIKEKDFIKCNSKVPFLVDLSQKLILYNLLDKIILDTKEMVESIWK